MAPCCGGASGEVYQQNVVTARRFLEGRAREPLVALESLIQGAVDRLDFEYAARIRDRLELSPDLVLTDINMPGLDGHDVIEAIRVMRADIPIIAVSGGGAIDRNELLLEASALGAVERALSARRYVGGG